VSNEPINALAEAINNKQPAVLVTVVEVKGASPAKVGAQLLLLGNGTRLGTVGGGRLESTILEDARKALSQGTPQLKHYSLKEDGIDAIGVLCGGELRVFFQPYKQPPNLIIVGGGHIGRPLKVMGEAAGFDVTIVDVEPGRADMSTLEATTLDQDTYVVLISTDHITDEAALRTTLQTPTPYIGMIGSRTKCQTILDHLRTDGYGDDALSRVYAPIGLDLGGPSPEEIAVAILAEVIAVRRGGKRGSRSR
jgi:xanthine dehydrogenase accessory factor